jgi:hypothetical protein
VCVFSNLASFQSVLQGPVWATYVELPNEKLPFYAVLYMDIYVYAVSPAISRPGRRRRYAMRWTIHTR